MSNILSCELVSWGEVQRLCYRLSGLIMASGYQPDIVVAIGRGGYVPSRLVCDCLDIMSLTSIKIEHYLSGSDKQEKAVIRYPLCLDINDQRVLIVDDVNDSGDTLQLASEHIHSFQPRDVRTAVMHDKRVTQYPVDYFSKRIIKWRWLIYPWALHEDINAFIGRLSPTPTSLDETQIRLADQFNIQISIKQLREIVSLSHLQHIQSIQ